MSVPESSEKKMWIVRHYKEIIIPSMVFSVAILGFFFGPGSFFVHSDVQVFPINDSEFEIKNKGMIQAKNVSIQIQSNNEFKISKINCPEVILKESSIWQTSHTLEVKRISTNITCVLFFELLDNSRINSITITSEDSPGYVWKYVEKTDGVIDDILKLGENVKYIQTFPSIIAGIIGIIVSILAAAITYLFQRKIRERELIREREMMIRERDATKLMCPNCSGVFVSPFQVSPSISFSEGVSMTCACPKCKKLVDIIKNRI